MYLYVSKKIIKNSRMFAGFRTHSPDSHTDAGELFVRQNEDGADGG